MEERERQFFQKIFETVMDKMDDIQQRVASLETGISLLKTELRQDVQGAVNEIAAHLSDAEKEIKQEIQDSETRMATAIYDVKLDLQQNIADSEKQMQCLLETDTDKRIQLLYEGQQLLTEKLSRLEKEVYFTQFGT